MNNCPCCNDILLKHADANGKYWFCQSCRQAMPVCTHRQSSYSTETIAGEFPTQLNQTKKLNYLLSSQIKNTINHRQLSAN